MATLREIEAAFIRAHEAGDTEAARALAQVLQANMPQQVAPQQPRPGTNTDAGFFESLGSGFGAGFTGTAESAALGAATLLEEEEELKAREKIQSIADRFTPEGGDQDSLTYKVASGLGSLAGFLVPAAAGVGAAALGAPGAIAAGIGTLGAGALGVGAGAGEASERARAYGATEEERNAAIRRGAAIGTLEVVPLARILRIPGVEKLGELLGGPAIEEGGSMIRRALATGGQEAAQEAAAGFLQNLNERGYNPTAELLNAGLIDEGIAGGGAGAILQATVDLFTKGRIRAQDRRAGEARQAEEAARNAPGADLGEIDTEAEAAARDTAQEQLGSEQLDLFPEEALAAREAMGDVTDDELALAAKALQDSGQEATPDNVRRAVTAIRNQDKGMGALADASPEELDAAIRELVEVDGREMKSLTEAEVKAKVDALRTATTPAAAPEQADLVQQIDEQETADIAAMYAEEAADKVPTPDPELPVADRLEQARGTLNILEQQAAEAESGSIEEAQLLAQVKRAEQIVAATETAEIENMLADEGDSIQRAMSDEATQRKQALRENVRGIDAERAFEQERTTAEGRAAILQDAIEASSATDFRVLGREFSARLEEAGYRNTTPTARELNTARRAIAVRDATPAQAAAPEAAPVDEGANVAPLEAQIPERVTPQRPPEQASFPGMGKRRGPEVAAEPEAVAAPEIVTAEMLDGLGVAKSAPIRKRIIGKDIADPASREALIKFANNPKVPEGTRINVARKLEGTPEGQLELFPTTTRGQKKDAPRATTVQPAAAVAPERGASPAPADVPVGGVAPEPVRGRDTGRPAAPDRQRVDEPQPDARDADARKGAEPAALAEKAEKPAAPKGPLLSEAARKRIRAATKSSAKPATKAETKPAAKPATKAETKPADKPATKAQTKPADKPATKAETKPAAKAETKPADKPKTEAGTKARERENEKRTNAALRGKNKVVPEFKNTAPNEVATEQDKAKIEKATQRVNVRDKEGKALLAYFGRTTRVVDGLLLAIYDVAHKTPMFGIRENTTQADIAMYAGTGAERAQLVLDWAEANLSPEANKFIKEQMVEEVAAANRILLRGQSIETKVDEGTKDQAAMDKAAEEAAQETVDQLELQAKVADDLFDGDFDPDTDVDKILNEFGLLLPKDAVAASSVALHPRVRAELAKGNLVAALKLLARTNPNAMVQTAARKLADVAGEVKVEVVEGLTDDRGNPVAGRYDVETNTVQLDSDAGANTHTVLHEVTHAAANAVLSNKSHPLTKQLTKLFNEVKGELNTAYGSTDVNEFVAEVFSNPEFRDTLSRISLDRQGTTALQRVVASLKQFARRLLGLQEASTGSALTRADALVDSVLSQEPGGSLSSLPKSRAGVRVLARAIGNVQKSIMAEPESSAKRKFLIQASSFLDGTTKTGRSIFLGLLDGQLVGDVAGAVGLGKLGAQLFAITQKMRGAIEIADDAFRKKLSQVEKWKSKAGKVKYKALNDLIYSKDHGATIYQVDPTLSKAEAEKKYGGQTDASGNPLMEVWEAQRADWNALGQDGQAIFVLMRDTYRDMYNKLKRSIDEQIDATLGKDSPAANKMKLQVFEQMFGKNSMEVYFPLVRNGAYKLEYNDNGERVFRSFESKAERNFAADALKGVEGVSDIMLYNQGIEQSYLDRPPAGFVKDVLDVLKANKIDPAVQEQVVQMFIETLPETSFAKSLQRRKNVQGYEQDSLEAFRRKGYDMSRQTERLRWGSRIRDIARDIANAKPPVAEGKQDAFNAAKEELGKRANFALNGAKHKGAEEYVQGMNQLAFVYTIGFNAASSLVNLSQIPLFVMPMLSPVYGTKASAAAVSAASKLVMNAGVGVEGSNKLTRTLRSGLDSYYTVTGEGDNVTFEVRDDLGFSPERIAELKNLAPLVKLAKQRGQLGSSHLFDVLGLDEGARAQRSGGLRRLADKITAISAVMFNSAERFNRQTALVAIYNLELAKLAEDSPKMSLAERQEKAAEVSLYKTMEYNGGAHLETSPRLTQEGLGRIAFMYKSYGLRMYATMLKTAKAAIDSSLPTDQRKIAGQQLLGIHGTALLFAGIHGLPLYGAVQLLADAFFLDDEEDDFNTIVRKAVKEGWYKGPLTELSGLDAGSRMRLTGLLIQANRFNPRASVEEDLIHYLGGPAWSVVSRMGRGLEAIASGDMERGIEQAIPAGLSNLVKASPLGRYGREGTISTRRGDPIYSGLTVGEMLGQAIGFAPKNYVLQQEMNQRNVNVTTAIVAKRSKLMKEYYIAARTGDDRLADVVEEIMKFNERHPYAGITGELLRKSLKSHVETSKNMMNGVSINPLMREMVEISNSEYEQGF